MVKAYEIHWVTSQKSQWIICPTFSPYSLVCKIIFYIHCKSLNFSEGLFCWNVDTTSGISSHYAGERTRFYDHLLVLSSANSLSSSFQIGILLKKSAFLLKLSLFEFWSFGSIKLMNKAVWQFTCKKNMALKTIENVFPCIYTWITKIIKS